MNLALASVASVIVGGEKDATLAVNRINLFQSPRRLMGPERRSLHFAPERRGVPFRLHDAFSFTAERQPSGNPDLLSKRGLMSHRRDFRSTVIFYRLFCARYTESCARICSYPSKLPSAAPPLRVIVIRGACNPGDIFLW